MHGHLFALGTDDAYLAHLGDGAQLVGQALGQVLQFAWGAFVAFDGQQEARRVAEVVDDGCRHHALRQAGDAEEGQPLADARPRHLHIVLRVYQRHKHIQHAVLAVGVGLGLVHVGEGEQVFLHLAGHLFLNLFGGGSRVDNGHHTLADAHVGELVLV